MVERTVIITCEQGLHLRPAKELCAKAMKYEHTEILLRFREREFNAKSLLGVLSACVQQMNEVTLVCSGPEEVQAAGELGAFLEGAS